MRVCFWPTGLKMILCVRFKIQTQQVKWQKLRSLSISGIILFQRKAGAVYFEKVWSPNKPVETPYGLADPDRAVKSFKWAIKRTKKRYGAWDIAWGKVHRAIAGNDINVPVGGCGGLLGCFRVLWFNKTKVNQE